MFALIGQTFKLFGVAVVVVVIANAWHEAHGEYVPQLKQWAQQQEQH